MNQQIAYLSQLKQTMELYQFMVKLCWLKTLLDAQVDEHGRSTAASAGSTGVVKKKSASGAKKIEAKPCQEKSTCKSLSRQEKSKVSTIDTSEVIKGRMYDFNNGRFLSVDPFIQGTSSQAINPYSYIQNNPLSGTDPTGYVPVVIPIIGKVISWVGGIWGAAEAGSSVGTELYEVTSGQKEAGEAAIDAGKGVVKGLVISKLTGVAGKAIGNITPEPIKNKVAETFSGKNSKVSNDSDTSSIGSQEKVASTSELRGKGDFKEGIEAADNRSCR